MLKDRIACSAAATCRQQQARKECNNTNNGKVTSRGSCVVRAPISTVFCFFFFSFFLHLSVVHPAMLSCVEHSLPLLTSSAVTYPEASPDSSPSSLSRNGLCCRISIAFFRSAIEPSRRWWPGSALANANGEEEKEDGGEKVHRPASPRAATKERIVASSSCCG